MGKSTLPGHPSMGSSNEYQPKGCDALLLGSKSRCGPCVGGRLAVTSMNSTFSVGLVVSCSPESCEWFLCLSFMHFYLWCSSVIM